VQASLGYKHVEAAGVQPHRCVVAVGDGAMCQGAWERTLSCRVGLEREGVYCSFFDNKQIYFSSKKLQAVLQTVSLHNSVHPRVGTG
jgi:hypothetical protein